MTAADGAAADGGAGLRVECTEPGRRWQAAGPDGAAAGTVLAWVKPDQRCSLFFRSCRPQAYRPLADAVAAALGRDLYTQVEADDLDGMAGCQRAGFGAWHRESYCRIPTSPQVTGLGTARVPAGLTVISAAVADEGRLRLLDDALRQDVPGADGWRWDPEGFRRETFCPEFDPATYLVAVELDGGEYAGLARVWMNPGRPRLGLIAVRPAHRRHGLARALLGQAFGVLSERGLAEVTAEVDDANVASLTLMNSLGARWAGGCAELLRRAAPG